MIEVTPSYEFRFFRLSEGFSFRDLPPMPTVCLLVADQIEPPYQYDDLVTDLMSVGCKFFMTWGKAASKFEDILDETIVALSIERDDKYLFAATTAHEKESVEEVVFFMLKAAIPNERAIRCCIGFSDGASAYEPELRQEIRKTVGN